MTGQKAYLVAIGTDGISRTYVTTNFEEVFKFKKICKENELAYGVRFREVKNHQYEYFNNTRTMLSKVKNFFK